MPISIKSNGNLATLKWHSRDAAGEGAAGAHERPECQSSQTKVGGGVCHLGRVEDERVWPPDF